MQPGTAAAVGATAERYPPLPSNPRGNKLVWQRGQPKRSKNGAVMLALTIKNLAPTGLFFAMRAVSDRPYFSAGGCRQGMLRHP
jgi:hypothetical protein